MLAGKYNKLRFFPFGGMKAPSVSQGQIDGHDMRDSLRRRTHAQATRGDIWAEAPIRLLPTGQAIAVNTSHLNISTGGIRAVKFGWSTAQGTRCVDLASVVTGLCIPGSCGVMTKDSPPPLNPFFAVIGDASGKRRFVADSEAARVVAGFPPSMSIMASVAAATSDTGHKAAWLNQPATEPQFSMYI